jgi:hypothetical protein
MDNITFFTQCYEGDWNAIINQGGYLRKLENINYPFSKKILIITNVNNRELVDSSAKKLKDNNIIDNFYFTDDFSNKVLEHFNIKEDSFDGGYWYSIAPLLAIYLCDTDYMVYLTGDSLNEKNDYDWISSGINMLKINDMVKVVNPVWNHQYSAAKDDENYYISLGNTLTKKYDDWSFGMGFSDQCFLIPTDVFKQQIYNENNDLSDIQYAKYTGECFEKRVSSYLKNNKFYRITNNNTTYYHPRWF